MMKRILIESDEILDTAVEVTAIAAAAMIVLIRIIINSLYDAF